MSATCVFKKLYGATLMWIVLCLSNECIDIYLQHTPVQVEIRATMDDIKEKLELHNNNYEIQRV